MSLKLADERIIPCKHISMQNDITIIQFPVPSQVQVAADWLANHQHENLALESALTLFLEGRIPPQTSPEFMAIAYTSSTGRLAQDSIRGIVMAQPGNALIALESSDRLTAEHLFTLTQPQGCPRKIETSSQVKHWLRPILLQHYSLEREHDSLVMVCTQVPSGGAGRWALPQDKPALQAYAEAYRAECGTGSLNQNWDDLIQQKRVAVLEHQKQIVAVVKRGSTIQHAIVVGIFTFPQFRRQGFARRLLAFFIQAMLEEYFYPSVKLWVDNDNFKAMALYESLGFRQIG
ncbi:MAG: GNAT family N-acetyltransferase, partial [Pseudanabaenales cyanobacterium]|nr:GNAT family N-acetyltransferase [Pseudanabaenales cyanobacterium]